MSKHGLLSRIRKPSIEAITLELAHGEEIREGFRLELFRFFDLLEQAIQAGDPAWLDPVLMTWTKSTFQLEQLVSDNRINKIIEKIFLIIFLKARDILSPGETNELVGTLLPAFSHALMFCADQDSELIISSLKSELEAAQESIARFDQSKSDFVNVTAHELRTPLTLVEGYASMLQEMPVISPQSGRIIQGLMTGTKRLRGIIDDMIDVSLIENNLLQLCYQPVWINRLFKMIVEDFSAAICSRNQHLEIEDFDGSNEPFLFDGERLYQAFTKIISNAIKYTPDGGKILITGRKLTDFIEIIMTDNGIGIDPDNQTQIFKKFSRLGSAELYSSGKTNFKGGGAGLGLTIAKGIIEAHGGSVWVESTGYDENQFPGATFHVILPQRKETQVDSVSTAVLK